MGLPGVVVDCDGLPAHTEAAIFAEHGFGIGPEQKALPIGKTLVCGAAAMAGNRPRKDVGADFAMLN